MPDRDQDHAMKDLARSVRECIETLGPTCTGQALGAIALHLLEADAKYPVGGTHHGSSDRVVDHKHLIHETLVSGHRPDPRLVGDTTRPA